MKISGGENTSSIARKLALSAFLVFDEATSR
jgi:hypothetical protein